MIWKPKSPAAQVQQIVFPQVHLKGPRITMRPPAQEDWPQWLEVRTRNKNHIQPFEPKWAKNALTQDFYQRRIERQAYQWTVGRANAFLIFKSDENRLIGGMNINNICRGAAQFASLGYWIDEEFEGQGYMAEALQATLAYCFTELKLHRVNASCLPRNVRSKNSLLKAGFKEEGFAEKYLEINGVWEDHDLFGLPRETWESRS